MQKTFIKLKGKWQSGIDNLAEAEEMSRTMKNRITSIVKEH